MLVCDIMQNVVLDNGKRYSEVYGPVLIRAQILNETDIILDTGIVSYEHYIHFNRKDGYDTYYVD